MSNYGNRTIAKNKDSKEKLSVTFWNLGAQFGELAYQALKTRKELPIKKYILYVFPYICFGAIMFFACKRIEKIEGMGMQLFSRLKQGLEKIVA